MKKLLLILTIISLVFLTSCAVKDIDEQPQDFEIVITPEAAEPQQEVIPGSPSAIPEPPVKEPEPAMEENPKTDSASLGEDKCDITAVLGFNSCLNQAEGIEVSIKNVGRGDLQGVFYRIYDKSRNKIGTQPELFDFGMGDEKTLMIPVQNYPGTWKVDIHPIQGNEICSNQQLVIIPETNCR